MKWYVFVLFMINEPNQPNAYLFTTPSYNTQQECAKAVVNPRQVPIFVNKLVQEFGYTPKIRTISCITEETIKKIDQMSNQEEETSV